MQSSDSSSWQKRLGFDFSHFKGDLFGGITAGIVALPLALLLLPVQNLVSHKITRKLLLIMAPVTLL